MDSEMIDRGKNGGWYFDRKISIANILTMLAIAAALASWQWAESVRTTVNAQNIAKHEAITAVEYRATQNQIKSMQERDKELMFEWVRQNQDIIRRLERIEDGLKRHIDKPVM